MSFSEGLKYAEGAERARDLAWARKCEEEDRYENECDYRYSQLCKELESKKTELTEEDFTEIEYKALGEYLRDYDLTPYTDLQEVIEAFVEEIDN
ncbi:MAG: hypothetical protein ACFNJI_05060 [Leptotrichia hongkongensis]